MDQRQELAWIRHRNDADIVTVVVMPVESADQLQSDEQWIVQAPGAAWDRDWLVREVEALGLNFNPDGSVDFRGYYVISVTEKRVNWGQMPPHTIYCFGLHRGPQLVRPGIY